MIAIVNYTLLVSAFCVLIYHAQRNKTLRERLPLKQIFTFFVILIFAFFIFWILSTLVSYSGDKFKTYDFEWMLQECTNGNELNYQNLHLVLVILTYLELPYILIGISIIKVKSHLDIIQGITQVGYLLKVSVFQRYKKHKLFVGQVFQQRLETIDSF